MVVKRAGDRGHRLGKCGDTSVTCMAWVAGGTKNREIGGAIMYGADTGNMYLCYTCCNFHPRLKDT